MVSESFDPFHFSVGRNERDCWFQRDRETAHTVTTATLLQEVCVECIMECGHWPHSFQILSCQTSVCGDFLKKEFIQATHEVWRN
jgi:hypothetical protein